jgi:hypothetical protein
MIFVLGPVFGLSAATIPLFAAAVCQRSAATVSYRGLLFVYASVWVAVAALTSLAVSILTATVHHRTLSIPVWLVPAGLFFIPAGAGAVIFLVGFRGANGAANRS